VAKRGEHPGYYWLTYDWSNLYPSCTHCNQRRKDKPRWGDLRYAETGGKMDQFPLEDENSRALSHEDDITREKNLLIDPCNDDPEKYLCYDITGQILPIEDNNKGESTIDIYHLKQRRLKKRRRDKINAVIDALNFAQKYKDNRVALRDFEDNILSHLLSDNCVHAGAVRYVNNNKEEFPII